MESKGIGADSINSLFHHVPSFVTSLDFSSFPVPASPLLKLLVRLPLLESLSLASDGEGRTFFPSPNDPTPRLPHLKRLSLLFPFCSEPLLTRLLSYNHSLSRLTIDFPALRAVKKQHLSSLLHLSIEGVMYSMYDCSRNDLAPDLMPILRNCQSLESFGFITEDIRDFKVGWGKVEKPPILQHLPLTVQRVTSSAIFEAQSILEFMTTRCSSLRRVELSRFVPGGCTFDPSRPVRRGVWEEIGADEFDIDGEDRIEELGKDLEISVRWLAERSRELRLKVRRRKKRM
ncbi:hypothetical protein JCM3765_005226 [Sporobolomyces pararoseus]